MSIQLLGLRSYTTKEGKTAKAEKFFDKKWRAASVGEVLKNHAALVAAIPEAERYNIYFTVAACAEKTGRELVEQTVIPFDIDGADASRVKETWFSVCKALGIIPEQSGALWSGHGLQLFVSAHEPITDVSYFGRTRPYYGEVCAKINAQLARDGLAGTADPAVWSPARLMRMPGTINRKPEKGLPDTPAYILSDCVEPVGFDLIKLSGIPIVPAGNQLSKAYIAAFPDADYKAILDPKTGCKFLHWAKEHPDDVSEDQWYAELNLTEHMPGGRELSHEYSRGYKGYSFHETERKAEQAKTSSGPRTCADINGRWKGCATCPNFGKVKSPIQIKSEDFVETESTGFYKITVNKEGQPQPGKPDVNGLVTYVKKTVPFKSSDGGCLYIWNGKMWEKVKDYKYFKRIADKLFRPSPPVHTINEVDVKLGLANYKPKEWFRAHSKTKINLNNGVYDWQEDRLYPHDQEYGFTYVMPFDYSADNLATPVFDKFLVEITCHREEYQLLILEYMGYCLSGDDCWLQKCMMLTGHGSNGKSKLIDLLTELAGPGNSGSTALEMLIKSENHRTDLEHQLFNVCPETSVHALANSEIFKSIVAGDKIQMCYKFEQPYSVRNTAKLFISCNELPLLKDTSHAIFRRLIIVPFDARFSNSLGNKDANIVKKMLPEMSGIFIKCMSAYKNVKRNGRFSIGPLSKEVLKQFKEESNVLETWFTDTYNILPNDTQVSEFKADIYMAYLEECKVTLGVRPVSNAQFFRQLKPLIRDIDSRAHFRNRDKKRERVLMGISKKVEVNDF